MNQKTEATTTGSSRYSSGARILAQGVTVDNDTRRTGLANNDLILGPTGAGKTRGYVLPNLLHTEESFLVTDTKGSLLEQVGPLLEARGMEVMELNFSDVARSPWGYDPLRFIRRRESGYREQDVLTVAAAMVPVTDLSEPFWEQAARNLLEALIAYTLECLPPEEQNLVSVVRLFAEAHGGVLDTLMDDVCTITPDSFCATRWKFLQTYRRAEKMYCSVLGILSQKLAAFSFQEVQSLFCHERQVDFTAMGQRPCAVFLNVSDCDFSLKSLSSLFYTQALQTLIAEADSRPDHRLRVPVRLYLDDFANLHIPEFDQIISIIRSREISVSIILQSITQLEGLYDHARAMTILDNCDHLLYLGGQSLETARFIGEKTNKPASAILNMPLETAWLFERGVKPREVRKYDLLQDSSYTAQDRGAEDSLSPYPADWEHTPG